MIDYIYIGSTPTNEDCLQVGQATPDQMRTETAIFKRQLQRLFPTADLRIKAERHDFGTYYEVVVYYDSADENAVNLAYQIESETPQFWDDEAKEELKTLLSIEVK